MTDVIFAGMETPGAWGDVLRAFAPWSNHFGALEPCGTVAAYQRHCRRDERPCPPCQSAVKRVRNEPSLNRTGEMDDRAARTGVAREVGSFTLAGHWSPPGDSAPPPGRPDGRP